MKKAYRAMQIARRRGGDIAQDALSLGAHRDVDLHAGDAVATLKGLGVAKALIASAACSARSRAAVAVGRLRAPTNIS